MADVSKRLEKAEKYIQKGKMDDALAEFEGILKDDPENDAVRDRAADLAISMGRNADAAQMLGVLFDKQATANDQAKAIISYKKLGRVGKPRVEQVFRYAQFIKNSSKKEALECFQHAVEEFTQAGQKNEALAAMKQLVTLEATLDNFRREGELATQLGDGKTASAAFFEAGELDKESGNSHGWYERAYAMDNSNAAATLAFTRSLLTRGDAATALRIIEPLSRTANVTVEIQEAYGRALMGLKRAIEAEPLIWALYERDPKQIDEVCLLIGTLIDVEQYDKAITAVKRLDEHEQRSNRRREMIAMLKTVMDAHPPNAEILEYMVGLYNACNMEHDYCDALIRLFELYYAAGNFLKAGDSLDAAAEVDPYSAGHQKRLEMLKNKIDPNRFRAIANRFTSAVSLGATEESEEIKQAAEGEPTILEDFMLQAEIFLQYSMRSKAVERMERINKLFPHEEEKNEKLRSIYMSAGFIPKYEGSAAPPAKPAAPAQAAAAAVAPTPSKPIPAAAPPAQAAAKPVAPTIPYAPPTTVIPVTSTPSSGTPAAVANENAVDNIARVTEITRNIYRQANVKGVLFAAVNDIGRHWSASRCVAGLCTLGKPPSAALEYCAPGVKQSDVMAIVKLIGILQQLAAAQGSVSVPNARSAPELAPIKPVLETLGIESVMAVTLSDGDEQVGILILEQCGAPRQWRPTDMLVLKTIADQMVLAVNNARLRSLMKNLAVTDEKSGLLKRASYFDVLLSEVKRSLEQSSPVCVMLLHFGRASALVKEVGETAVESMMQQIGQICASHIRQNDVAVRYELTTIALVLADTNDKNAFFVVDKLRKVLASVKIPGTDRVAPMDVGIAEAVLQIKYDPIDIVTEVINRAESALAQARAEGGNKAQSLAPVLEPAVA